jgi:hypothetical protein
MEAGAGVAWPGWPRQRVVRQMEHHTGADGPVAAGPVAAGTGVDEQAAEPWHAPSADRETEAPGGAAAERELPATGQPRVDAALRLLDRLPGLPVGEHPELFEQVHAQLSEVLGELDSGPAGPAGLAGG